MKELLTPASLSCLPACLPIACLQSSSLNTTTSMKVFSTLVLSSALLAGASARVRKAPPLCRAGLHPSSSGWPLPHAPSLCRLPVQGVRPSERRQLPAFAGEEEHTYVAFAGEEYHSNLFMAVNQLRQVPLPPSPPTCCCSPSRRLTGGASSSFSFSCAAVCVSEPLAAQPVPQPAAHVVGQRHRLAHCE